MNKLTELKELKRLLIKYLPEFDPYTDCIDKWFETVGDEVKELLKDEDYDQRRIKITMVFIRQF